MSTYLRPPQSVSAYTVNGGFLTTGQLCLTLRVHTSKEYVARGDVKDLWLSVQHRYNVGGDHLYQMELNLDFLKLPNVINHQFFSCIQLPTILVRYSGMIRKRAQKALLSCCAKLTIMTLIRQLGAMRSESGEPCTLAPQIRRSSRIETIINFKFPANSLL